MGKAEVVIDAGLLQELKTAAFNKSKSAGKGGQRDSMYKPFFVEREADITKLISGELAELDITDIIALSPEKKNWGCSMGFNRTGFTTTGNMAPAVAVAKVCQGLLAEDDTSNYVVRITNAGMLKVTKEGAPKPVATSSTVSVPASTTTKVSKKKKAVAEEPIVEEPIVEVPVVEEPVVEAPTE